MQHLVSPVPAAKSPLVTDGCPARRLEHAVLGWGKIGLIIAAVIAALGGAGYVFALGIGILAGAFAALAAAVVLLAKGLVACVISVGVMMALGAKK